MYKRVTRELVLFFVLMVILLPTFCHLWDVECWRIWTRYINKMGIGNVYDSGANYPPLLMYFLSGYNFIFGTDQKISENMNWLKIVPLLFDLLPIVILILFRNNYALKKGYYFLLLFNFAYLYNTIIWGQFDSIHSNLALTAIFVSFRYPTLAVVLFVLSLNMKLQAIIFFPVLLLCLTTTLNSIRSIAKAIGVGIALQLVLLTPFILSQTLNKLWAMIIDSGSYYPVVSLTAYNLWHLILKSNPTNTPDNLTILSVTYKTLGLTLFFISSAIVLFPIAVKTLYTVISKIRIKTYNELVYLSTGIVSVLFFYVNTEMHERYSHPAVIFLFFYAIYSRKFGLYILVSIAYLLNLERELRFFHIDHNNLFFFKTRFISWLFLISIIWGTTVVYKDYELKKYIRYIADFLRLKFSRKNIKTV